MDKTNVGNMLIERIAPKMREIEEKFSLGYWPHARRSHYLAAQARVGPGSAWRFACIAKTLYRSPAPTAIESGETFTAVQAPVLHDPARHAESRVK